MNKLSCARFDFVFCILDGAAMRAGVQTGDRIIKVSPCSLALVTRRFKVTESPCPLNWLG